MAGCPDAATAPAAGRGRVARDEAGQAGSAPDAAKQLPGTAGWLLLAGWPGSA